MEWEGSVDSFKRVYIGEGYGLGREEVEVGDSEEEGGTEESEQKIEGQPGGNLGSH